MEGQLCPDRRPTVTNNEDTMKKVLLGLSLVLAVSTIAHADDTFKAEYVSGKADFEKKVKGELIIGDQALTMMDGKRVVFTIPLVIVTKASNTRNAKIGTDGFPLLGIAFSHVEEFVYVTTETADRAEVLIFQVKKKASPGIVAKIEFAAKKAKPERAASAVVNK
jgi:hypothetical protein